MNKKIGQSRKDGHFAIRTFHRAKKRKRDARFLFKCGCCDEKLESITAETAWKSTG